MRGVPGNRYPYRDPYFYLRKKVIFMPILKQLAAHLPNRWQTEIKRNYFGRQIKKGTFGSKEPEYKLLDNFIKRGDWIVDIGANVGHYTKRFSELAGKDGRVIAFEPVPTTFSLLSANVLRFAHPNVSLINAAASNELDIVGMSMPKFPTGLTNFYQAHISSLTDSTLPVATISLDSLCINHHISLVKIDAEGHESFVLAGMRKIIEASHPVLIIETSSKEIIADLATLGYVPEKLQYSPNILFKPKRSHN
ncbi:methyltransferase, FkbM family [Candidatus Electrothrix aarhusensis]|uniref:Methyltransferase, FkbM family n=1 Tax=Candidatus Electrothrix aarhusensis TaxID=1859131 RepID=A0A444J1Y1_9BACT|nr:methyltransferase, FkbM family [Candidatus Electrothrix aarhusensis]